MQRLTRMHRKLAGYSAQVLLACTCDSVIAAEYRFYAGLRTQVEAVVPDNETPVVDDYIGLRDAYSRIGLKVSHAFSLLRVDRAGFCSNSTRPGFILSW